MNIVDKYIENNGKLLIAISGLSKSGKSLHALRLSKDLKLIYLDQKMYCKQEECYTYEDIDIDKMNKDIGKHKNLGVIVSGFDLRKDVIKQKMDYHIHISIPKQVSLERRLKADPKLDPYQDKLVMNKKIYPSYLESKEKSKINKFINAVNMSFKEVYIKILTEVFTLIEKNLYGDDYEELGTKKFDYLNDVIDISEDPFSNAKEETTSDEELISTSDEEETSDDELISTDEEITSDEEVTTDEESSPGVKEITVKIPTENDKPTAKEVTITVPSEDETSDEEIEQVGGVEIDDPMTQSIVDIVDITSEPETEEVVKDKTHEDVPVVPVVDKIDIEIPSDEEGEHRTTTTFIEEETPYLEEETPFLEEYRSPSKVEKEEDYSVYHEEYII